jgi:2-aminoadipate transaminase
MKVRVDRTSAVPLYRQIVDQIRGAITSGQFEPEDRLPTTRALAGELGVNRLTINRAYEDLMGEGLIRGHVGRGTFIADRSTDGGAAAAVDGPQAESLAWEHLIARTPARALDGVSAGSGQAGARPGMISFASLFPDPGLFPVEPFRRAMDHVLRHEGGRLLGYGPPAGHPPLRAWIAQSLRARDIEADPQHIIITNGSQQGIDLVARALLDPGDHVLVENPTYTGAVQVFQSYGAELIGIPMQQEGTSLPQLEEAIARRRPKLIYVMPNFQNPTSLTMSLASRRSMLRLAQQRQIPILEDDFGGDLRFEGPELPSLRAMDRSGHVIYLSTFAKKLLPGIRIGWLAAPPAIVDRLTGLKKIADFSTSLVLQAALYEFCRRGDMDRHLVQVIAAYRERRDAMLAALKRFMPPDVTWGRPQGGLVIWLSLPPRLDEEEVARVAAERGVLVGRGDLFHITPGARRHFRLTYAQASPREIQRGIKILGEVIRAGAVRRSTDQAVAHDERLPLI